MEIVRSLILLGESSKTTQLNNWWIADESEEEEREVQLQILDPFGKYGRNPESIRRPPD